MNVITFLKGFFKLSKYDKAFLIVLAIYYLILTIGQVGFALNYSVPFEYRIFDQVSGMISGRFIGAVTLSVAFCGFKLFRYESIQLNPK